jgi:hypothetical protein
MTNKIWPRNVYRPLRTAYTVYGFHFVCRETFSKPNKKYISSQAITKADCRYITYTILHNERHYATSRKVACSRPDEVKYIYIYIFFFFNLPSPSNPGILSLDFRWCHWIFQSTQFFQAHYGPAVHSASNTNEYQKEWNYVSGEHSAAGA